MLKSPSFCLAAICWALNGTAYADALTDLENFAESLESAGDDLEQRRIQDQIAILPLTQAELLACTTECHQALARAWSAHCLGFTPNHASQTTLINALKDPSPKVRREALEGLANVGDRTTIKALMKAAARESVPDLQALAKQASEQVVARSRNSKGPQDFSLLTSTDPMERKAAMERAGKSNDWNAVPLLMEATSDHHPAIREAAILALGKLGDDRALPLLHKVTREASGRPRHAAIGAIAQLSNTQSLPHLAPLIHSEDTDTRRYVARALGWIATPEKMELLSVLVQDSEETVRTEVLLAVGRSDSKITGPLLVQLLKDDLVYLRSESALLLSKAPTEIAAPPLINALEDKDPLVRINAAISLGNLGETSAIEALKKRIRKSENPEEASYYVKVLGQLGITVAE